MNNIYVMAVLFLLVVLVIGIQLILSPAKLLWKLMVNSFVGLVSVLLVNYFMARYGFYLPVTLYTVAIAGFLGIPGIVGLTVYYIWFI
jgi:inhibitor of the pro-sigma K processing machinery